MAASKLTLKLVVDTSSHKVLFAEAGKDVVDFLLGLLTLPLGTVINLLSADCEVHHNKSGCIANLYQCLDALDNSYFESDRTKSIVLHATRSFFPLPNLFLPAAQPAPFPSGKRLLGCASYTYNPCSMYFSDELGAKCPRCFTEMSKEMTFVAVASSKRKATVGDAISSGYMKSMVAFKVMDDLSLSPMSAVSYLTHLNQFNVKDLSAVEEKTVALGPDEALQLLKASLQSKTVLTDVFLAERKSEANESTEGSEKEEKTESTEDSDSSRKKTKMTPKT